MSLLGSFAKGLLVDALEAGGDWLVDKLRRVQRRKPAPEPLPFSAVAHREAQIHSATTQFRVPPPRKHRPEIKTDGKKE